MPSVALVHDWLNQYGGAERVLERMVGMFPGAPVYTSMYWPLAMPQTYRQWDIRTTWMDRLPGIHRWQQLYFPLYAAAFGHLDLANAGYDLVLSNKSGFCHGVQTGGTPHLCYCLSPTRYVWQFDLYAARERLPTAVRLLLKPMIKRLQRWDYEAAQCPALHFIAISGEIRRRIVAYYDRDSEIVYPPVDLDRFAPEDDHDDYYLIVSRLVPYKRIDLAVKAFGELGLPLVIAGDGRDRQALEALAGDTVRFLGHVPDADLPKLLARCKAFVFPGYEDFGIAPVEAQAAGRPVVAYRAGGALDSVIEGKTGVFFDEPTPESLADAVARLDAMPIDPDDCRRSAERFSLVHFRTGIAKAIAQLTS